MGATTSIIANVERGAAQQFMGHPLDFVQQLVLWILGLVALDESKGLFPQRLRFAPLCLVLQHPPQNKGPQDFAFKAAAGRAQLHGLARLRGHRLVMPLCKEIIGVKGQQLGEQPCPQQVQRRSFRLARQLGAHADQRRRQTLPRF